MKKDSNGCDTCDCSSPCDGVICPDTSVCVPAPVECIAGPCPEVLTLALTAANTRVTVESAAQAKSHIGHLAPAHMGCHQTVTVPGSAFWMSSAPLARDVALMAVECHPENPNVPLTRTVLRCENAVAMAAFVGIHARLAALAIRDFDSSVFVPECDSSGEYQQIQTHYSLKWCVDKEGKEIP
ncbi:thyroglobulin type-1 repeat-containing domain protein, partial [Ancylostoma duodenale]